MKAMTDIEFAICALAWGFVVLAVVDLFRKREVEARIDFLTAVALFIFAAICVETRFV